MFFSLFSFFPSLDVCNVGSEEQLVSVQRLDSLIFLDQYVKRVKFR